MVQARCIQKFRDKNNNIKSYLLEDSNGQQLRIAPDQLKNAIFMRQIDVINLKLTKDGKLIDKEESTVKKNNVFMSASPDVFKELWDYIQSLEVRDNWPSDLAEEIGNKVLILIERLYKTKFRRIHTIYDPDTYIFTSGELVLRLAYIDGLLLEDYDIEGSAWCIGIPNVGYDVIKYCGTKNNEVYKHIYNMTKKIVQSTVSLAHSKRLSYYEFVMSTLDIISKFTDAKYSTVARYLVPGEIEEENTGKIWQHIRFKGSINDSKKDKQLDVDMTLITVYMKHGTNGKYEVVAYTPNNITSELYKNEYRIENVHGHLSEKSMYVDLDNKDYKREIKLFLEQEFKRAYNMLRYYIDTREYEK